MKQEPNVAVSPCAFPKMELEPLLRSYREIGFRKFEVFSGWVHSAFSWQDDPADYLQLAAQFGIRFSSYHLPPIQADDYDRSLEQAIAATRFAKELGVTHVIYKASDRPTYIRAARQYLDSIADTGLTPVLQNHKGSPITTLDDYREVIEGIDDRRMKTLLEVGHFHAAGISWEEGYALLGDTVSLVHLKDLKDGQSVAFGRGEIDLKSLFRRLRTDGYTGDYVVEMESGSGTDNMQLLRETYIYLSGIEGIIL